MASLTIASPNPRRLAISPRLSPSCDAYASNGDTPCSIPANTGLGVGCPAKQSPNPKNVLITKA